jgi:Ca-activated chloride channel family protein
MLDHSSVVREGATAFVKALDRGDRARIGSFADEVRISPPQFTADRQALLNVLETDLQTSGPSPVWWAIDRSITALLHEPGRRVVVVFTDGYDRPVRGQIHTEEKDVRYRARYDDVMVYAIGFPSDQSPSMPFQSSPGFPQFGRKRETTDPPSPALRELAVESGGGYFEWGRNPFESLGATFTRVADELHRQYLLGFTPAKLDGRLHDLDVRVRRPGVTVRARSGYVAR